MQLDDGKKLLCEYAATLTKGKRAVTGDSIAGDVVIGDVVEVHVPQGHDVGIIEAILPRRTELVRKDPTERVIPQVLAANFDQIIIVQPIGELNIRRLERELVLAFETSAKVAIVLTKADLIKTDDCQKDVALDISKIKKFAGPNVPVFEISIKDIDSIERVRQLLNPGSTTVLMGRSGVGKSSLINTLYGADVQKTASVRATDGKGRHTTVNREIIELPGGARIIDMPGVRGLGLWEADTGINNAFADIEALAQNCKFRDCKHSGEPGCAVQAAIKNGNVAQERYDSYINLRTEAAKTTLRRKQSHWKNK